MTAPDPMDLPEDDEAMELLYPFTACASNGGPYDDDSFVAGVQLGRIDQALMVAGQIGTTRVSGTVRTALVDQLQLAAMARGFPGFVADAIDGMPEWTNVTFTPPGYLEEGL